MEKLNAWDRLQKYLNFCFQKPGKPNDSFQGGWKQFRSSYFVTIPQLNPSALSLSTSVVLFLFWLIPACGLAQNQVRFLAEPVSSQVGMYSYRVNDLRQYTKYDHQGRIVKKIFIQRDKHGNVVGKTHYNQQNICTLKISYRFDERHRLTQKIKHAPDGTPVKIIHYTYDPNTFACKQIDMDGNGKVLKSHIYIFNQCGERIKKSTFDATGTLTRNRIYLFDETRKRIRDYTFSSGGIVQGSTAYQYNEHGFMTGIQYYDGEFQLKGKSRIEFDDSGRPVKKIRLDAMGKLKSVLQYSYLAAPTIINK